MKKQINKKSLAFTSIIIFSILIFNGSCSKNSTKPDPDKPVTDSSKIIYTDVNPDSSVIAGFDSSNHYDLDLNHDGIADFSVLVGSGPAHCAPEAYNHTLTYVRVKSYNANNFGDTILSPGTALDAIPLDSGREINQNLIVWAGSNLMGWVDGGACGVSLGRWGYNHNTEKYMPLRLVVGSSVYFGWLRLSVSYAKNAGGTYYLLYAMIKDYAYNSITNGPILAGQTK